MINYFSQPTPNLVQFLWVYAARPCQQSNARKRKGCIMIESVARPLFQHSYYKGGIMYTVGNDLKTASDEYRTAHFHLNDKPEWLESLDKFMKMFVFYVCVAGAGACAILLIWI